MNKTQGVDMSAPSSQVQKYDQEDNPYFVKIALNNSFKPRLEDLRKRFHASSEEDVLQKALRLLDWASRSLDEGKDICLREKTPNGTRTYAIVKLDML